MRVQPERLTLLFTSILCGFFPKIEVSGKQKFQKIAQALRMPILPVTGFLHGQPFALQPSVQNVTVMQPRLGRRLLLRVLVPQLLLHLPVTAPIKIPKSCTAIFRVTRYTPPLPASIFNMCNAHDCAIHCHEGPLRRPLIT